jgi:phage anti-repressor protein
MSTKGNAKRTLSNNFTEGEDYQILFIPTDEKSIGRPEEDILLNVDTFKNLCMITKTEKSKKKFSSATKKLKVFVNREGDTDSS